METVLNHWFALVLCLPRGLTNKVEKVVPTIVATAVLHNIARKQNESDELSEESVFDDNDNEASVLFQDDNNRRGSQY